MESHVPVLHFDQFVPFWEKQSKIHYLYPYNAMDVAVVLVYGSDLKRRTDVLFVPEWAKIVSIWVLIFWFIFASILCIMRQIWNLNRGDFISSLIDTASANIGFGNLQMNHRLERLFFGMLLIFSIVAGPLWQDVFLVQTYQILDEKVSTFQELATINAPIYSSITLSNRFIVQEKLRYALS